MKYYEGHHVITQASIKTNQPMFDLIAPYFSSKRPDNIIDLIKDPNEAAYFGVASHSGRTLNTYELPLRENLGFIRSTQTFVNAINTNDIGSILLIAGSVADLSQ